MKTRGRGDGLKSLWRRLHEEVTFFICAVVKLWLVVLMVVIVEERK